MNFLKNYIEGSREIQGTPSIHPNFVRTPQRQFNTGHEIKVAIMNKPYDNRLFVAPPVGYSVPDPVFFARTPVSQIIASTPEMKQTAINKVGGCN